MTDVIADHNPDDYDADLIRLVDQAEGNVTINAPAAAVVLGAQEPPKVAPQGLSEPPEGGSTGEPSESHTAPYTDALAKLGEAEAKELENFAYLAEHADSEPARKFWRDRADAIAAVAW